MKCGDEELKLGIRNAGSHWVYVGWLTEAGINEIEYLVQRI